MQVLYLNNRHTGESRTLDESNRLRLYEFDRASKRARTRFQSRLAAELVELKQKQLAEFKKLLGEQERGEASNRLAEETAQSDNLELERLSKLMTELDQEKAMFVVSASNKRKSPSATSATFAASSRSGLCQDPSVKRIKLTTLLYRKKQLNFASASELEQQVEEEDVELQQQQQQQQITTQNTAGAANCFEDCSMPRIADMPSTPVSLLSSYGYISSEDSDYSLGDASESEEESSKFDN